MRLIRRFEVNLYRVARAILKRDEDCADAMQDTVLIAYRSIRQLRQPAYFKTWLIRILINQCNQILRKRKKVFPFDDIRGLSAQSKEMEWIELKAAIDQLEESLRLVIILHYIEDLSVKEIAKLLELPEGTVKSRLHRARKILSSQWVSSERVMNGE